MSKEIELKIFGSYNLPVTVQENFSVFFDYSSESYQKSDFQEDNECMIHIKILELLFAIVGWKILFFASLSCTNANDFHEDGAIGHKYV